MSRFDGRTVLISGAGSGIGFEMARQFLAEGALVYAADLNPDGAPAGSMKLHVDVTDPASFEAAIERVIEDHGHLDVLCNNAGLASTTNAVECTVEEWDRTFAVNTRGVFLGTKYALPHMLAAAFGAIVNTASVAGQVGLKDRAAYCASKGAVIAFTRQVAVQYAGTGVRANCICPGTVDSPWVGRLLAEAEDPVAARGSLVARQPMGRLGTSIEVATAALYLASDDASFMTGSELVIDGGLLAG
jgi:meso-butanediol dehydrogenase / (S,S)-butanediol dehydrogenase / diacetyl reductase